MRATKIRLAARFLWSGLSCACVATGPAASGAAPDPIAATPALIRSPPPASPIGDGSASVSPGVVAADEPPVGSRPPTPVPPCQGEAELVVEEVRESGVVVTRRSLSGSASTRLSFQPVKERMDLSPDGRWVVGASGVSEVGEPAWRPMIGAAGWIEPRFVPGTALIVGARPRFEPGSRTEILVADQEVAQVVARFEGRSPSVAVDSAVVFLRDDPSLHGVQEHVSVHHYRRGAVRELRKIAMLPYLDVTEVVAMGGERFVYGARDEHEQHYYDDRDRPFAPAPDGRHVLSSSDLGRRPKMKEQLGLRVSRDGRLAVFAERNWSELSYLVVADASGGARRELPVFGSFPAIAGQHVVFSSDPSFVTNAPAGSRGFRQIESWALYAYDLGADSLCLVGEYAHPVGAG